MLMEGAIGTKNFEANARLCMAKAATEFLTNFGASAAEDKAKRNAIKRLEWQETFKKNYRLMSQDEQLCTIERIEKLANLIQEIALGPAKSQHAKACCSATPSISEPAKPTRIAFALA